MKIIDICELRSEELWEARSSQLHTQLLRLRKKKNLKKKIHNFVIIILSRVYNEPIQRPAPSWLVSLIGRALHRRARVRIPYNPEFFSGFLFATAKVAYITAMIFLHT